MIAQQLSSGDLIADRRAGFARMLFDNGEAGEAADVMRQALEQVPGWAAGWFELAGYEERADHADAAAAALHRVLALNPGDLFGAGLKLALLTASGDLSAPPSLHIERLFDDYARRFDAALVERLGYCVPEKLAALLIETTGTTRFSTAVDLGCGTGLFGAQIRERTDRLEGFDLSAGMLAQARQKGLYDHLARADLSLAPDLSGVFSPGFAKGRAVLVAAADVMIYLGDLKAAFAIMAQLVACDAFLAFSVEDAGAAGDVVLRPSLRFMHAEAYVAALVDEHGFTMRACEKTVIRTEAGAPISGLLFVAQKQAGGAPTPSSGA